MTPNTRAAAALLPCPAGHIALLHKVKRDDDLYPRGWYYVDCIIKNCGWHDGGWPTAKEAHDHWNDRDRTTPAQENGSASEGAAGDAGPADGVWRGMAVEAIVKDALINQREQETIDALAVAHSASASFSDRYAACSANLRREVDAIDKVLDAFGIGVEQSRSEGGSLRIAHIVELIRDRLAPKPQGGAVSEAPVEFEETANRIIRTLDLDDPKKSIWAACQIVNALRAERARASAPPQPCASDDCVLVPRKPTEDMLHAAIAISPLEVENGVTGHSYYPLHMYNAMIAAAPSPTAGHAVEAGDTRDRCEHGIRWPHECTDCTQLSFDRRMPNSMRDWLTGMSVSVDVSTDEHDAKNRYFGTVTEVMDSEDKHQVILLVQDAEPNFERKPQGGAVSEAMEKFVEFCADINHGYSFTDWPTFYRLRNDAIDELEIRRASATPRPCAPRGEPVETLSWDENGPTGLRCLVEVIDGCEGPCLSVANPYTKSGTRIAGPKPWGGGSTIHSFEVSVDELVREALDLGKKK